MFQQIIVPLDGSEESAEALAPAAAMARRVGAPMHILALHRQGSDPSSLEATVLDQSDVTGDVVRVVDVRPVEESVAGDIRRLANRWGPSLVVMATHGRGRSAAVLGSVANDVLAHGDQPVMLIGPSFIRGRFRTHGPAIIAADGEDDEVLSLAASLLAETDFDPVIANVVSPRTSQRLDLVRTGPQPSDVPTDSVDAQRAAHALEAATDRVDIDYDVYHHPDPAEPLVEQAIVRRAGLVIMTTHARTGLDRLTAGSVMADVVRDAPCPVLVAGISA